MGFKGLDDGEAFAHFQSRCFLLQAREKVPLQMAYINDRKILCLCFQFS